MARKKKRKKSTKKSNLLKYELLGLLFIFLAIFGSGASAISEGAIPGWLEHFFHFFLGIWYFVASIFLFITGIVLLIKRRFPNYFTRKMMGFYVLFAGILLLTHVQTYEPVIQVNENISILASTWDNLISYISGQIDSRLTGGGMIGAILFAFCNYLFSFTGVKIVAAFSIIIGVLFITDMSIGSLTSKLFDYMKEQVVKIREKSRTVKETRDEKKQEQRFEKENQLVDIETETEIESEPIINDFADVAYGKTAIPPVKEKVEQVSKEPVDLEEDDVDVNPAATETENHDYVLPSLDLLAKPAQNNQQYEKSQVQATVRKLEKTFHSFGVKAKVTKVHVGPAVTKYEVSPEAGVKVSKIVSLNDDIALALAAKDIRIEAPIPGKSAVGIEVPNKEVAMVSLREVMEGTMKDKTQKLLVALGRDISGDAVVTELSKMPHLLIAGATGSGKSVCVNGIITTLLMRTKPHEVKMMMIDPKKVELNVYNGIPHLLAPVVTDPKKASRALKKIVAEMERRYDLFSDSGTRNIKGYNEYVRKYNLTTEEQQPEIPFIVVLVDELADLMMVASSDVEDSITRLAQMARAAGIHLIIATQRPSVDVITGVIKANIPSRIAFSVSSAIDSRTILDSGGAEKLLGRGDMLFLPVGSSKPTRVQGAFLSDDEVERIVDHCIDQQKASYQEEMIPEDTNEVLEEVDDEIYDDAVQLVTEMQTASVSMLQRRFRVGYTRAARLIDAMEDRGIVGPYEGSKPRHVLVSKSETEEQTTSM